MSVGGLAIAVGLIIDDAIVVIEAIARGIAEHPDQPRRATIAAAVGTIAGAMVASTVTTVVVFLPLGLLSGVTGFFFRALAFTLATSLIVSLVLAIGVAPILANALLRRAPPHRARADRLHAAYEPILRWALAHRPAVCAAAAVVLATTIVLLLQLPSDFLPKLDEGEFEIKYTLPAGATLADSDAAAGRLEHAVLADRDVASVGRLTGIDTNGFSPTQASTGTLRVALRAGGRASYDVISDRLRDALGDAVPAASLDFHQLLEDQINDLSGAPQPIEITLSGPDQQTLIDAADKTTAAIAKVPGVVDAFDGVVYDDPSLRIAPQSARLGGLSITAGDLGDALGARMQGAVAAQLPGESATIPVNVRVAGTPGADALGDAALFTKNGATTLSALARIDRPPRASDINEENGRRIDRVTANIEGASLSAVVAGLKTALAQVALPPGYSAIIGGAYETQQASFREFVDVIAAAIVLVFSVMLATFGSFRLPLVILGAIPLALIGVAAALFITRTPINVSSFMGLLLLVGIVVKNGILLIDVANKRRDAGDDVTTALLVAGSTRVRPIVMTALAAIGGLFPLALGLGSGAEMERPLAIAVIGGLSTATAFTLVLIPVLYATFAGSSRRGAPLRPALATLLLVLLPLVSMHAAGAQTRDAAEAAATLRFAHVDLAAAQQLAVAESPDVHVAQAVVDGARAALAAARAANGVSLVRLVERAGCAGRHDRAAIDVVRCASDAGRCGRLCTVAEPSDGRRTRRRDRRVVCRAHRADQDDRPFITRRSRRGRFAARAPTPSTPRSANLRRRRRAFVPATRRGWISCARKSAWRTRRVIWPTPTRRTGGDRALARELDRPATAFAATEAAPVLTGVAIPAPDAAVAQALARRADLRSAEANVRASSAGVAAARSAVLPALTLNGGYARGIDSGFATNGPTLSAQLSIPVGGGVAARVHAQAALLAAADARRAGIERAVALEVGAAARNAAAAVAVETAATTAMAAARAELDAVTLGYARGASTSLDVQFGAHDVRAGRRRCAFGAVRASASAGGVGSGGWIVIRPRIMLAAATAAVAFIGVVVTGVLHHGTPTAAAPETSHAAPDVPLVRALYGPYTVRVRAQGRVGAPSGAEAKLAFAGSASWCASTCASARPSAPAMRWRNSTPAVWRSISRKRAAMRPRRRRAMAAEPCRRKRRQARRRGCSPHAIVCTHSKTVTAGHKATAPRRSPPCANRMRKSPPTAARSNAKRRCMRAESPQAKTSRRRATSCGSIAPMPMRTARRPRVRARTSARRSRRRVPTSRRPRATYAPRKRRERSRARKLRRPKRALPPRSACWRSRPCARRLTASSARFSNIRAKRWTRRRRRSSSGRRRAARSPSRSPATTRAASGPAIR